MNRSSSLLFAVALVCSGMAGAEEHQDVTGAALVSPDQVVRGSISDPRDKAKYNTVRIGTQTWMAQNLNFETRMSWCYDNDPDNCEKYGRLYAWTSAQKACPNGWHLPSDEGWRILERSAGITETGGGNLKSENGWSNDGSGSDDYGFNVLPAGFRLKGDKFGCMGSFAQFWSATENGAEGAWYRYFYCGKADMERGKDVKTDAFSVRCLKD